MSTGRCVLESPVPERPIVLRGSAKIKLIAGATGIIVPTMPNDDTQKKDQAVRILQLERELSDLRRRLAAHEELIVRQERELRQTAEALRALRDSLSFRIGWGLIAPARVLYDTLEKGVPGGRVELALHFLKTGLSHPVRLIGQIDRANLATLRKALKQESPKEISANLSRLIDGGEPSVPSPTPDAASALSHDDRPAPIALSETRIRHLNDKTAALEQFLSEGARLVFTVEEAAGVTVLLILHNQAALTLACLRSLRDKVTVPIRLLLVDNASSDQTGTLLERVDGATVLRNEENLGFLLAANQALAFVETPFLLFLNNDAEVETGALETAMKTLEAEPTVGAVGGKVLLLDGTLQEAGCIVWRDGSCSGYGRGDDPDQPEYGFKRAVDFCSGVFLMTRTALFRACGGFDERFAPAYYEEVDYCFGLQRQGYRVVYHPRCVVHHVEFGSAESSGAAIDQQAERQIVFADKHADLLRERPSAGRAAPIFSRTAALFPQERILYLDDRVPHRFQGSGAPRANLIIHTMATAGRFVTVYPLVYSTEAAGVDSHVDLPEEVEIVSGRGWAAFPAFLRDRSGYYDQIVACRPSNMTFFNQCRSDAGLDGAIAHARILYDTECITALRKTRLMHLQGEPDAETVGERLLSEEMEIGRRADRVIVVSTAEAEVYRRFGYDNVHIIGHAIDPCPTAARFAERAGLLFVGQMVYDNSPNVDSMEWFITEVFPRIRLQLPEIGFHAIGANGASRLKPLARPGVHFHGQVKDLYPFYETAKVVVCPTRYSAGIPLKLYEAAAHGVPVFATDHLIAQADWEKGNTVVGASHEDAQAFADELIALYTDEPLWLSVRESALRLIEAEHTRAAFAETLERILTDE